MEIWCQYLFCGLVLTYLLISSDRLEKIMSTTTTGLASLQAFVISFQAFVTQLTADVATLTTSVNNAIAALQNNEDPSVQAAVAQLQTGQTTLQGLDTAIDSLGASLNAADAPPATTPSADAKRA